MKIWKRCYCLGMVENDMIKEDNIIEDIKRERALKNHIRKPKEACID